MTQIQEQTANAMVMYSGLVNDICKPLFNISGIRNFGFVEIQPNGDYLALESNVDIYKKLLENGVVSDMPLGILSQHTQPGMYNSKLEGEGFLQPLLADTASTFNIDNILFILDKIDTDAGTKLRLFIFSSDKDNADVNSFYINNIDLIRHFNQHFVERMTPFLKSAKPYTLSSEDKARFNQKLAEFNAQNGLQMTKNKINDYYGLKIKGLEHQPLTKRELEIIELYRQGHTAKETAAQLHIAKRTVERHFENIRKKLNCHSKGQILSKIMELQQA